MSRPASLARNVSSNWAGIGLSIVYALVITPVVVKALDEKLYGAWSFLNGLLAYSELFYLGLGSAIIRYVAEARVTDDRARINRLTSVILSIYTGLGLLCLVILLALSTRIPLLFADPLPPDVARAVSYTCILLGGRLFMVFVASGFGGLMAGHDRFDVVNVVGMCSTAIRFVAIPLLVHSGQEPLLTLAALTFIMSAAETVALGAIAFWYVPGLSILPALPRIAELKMLYGFGLPSFFVLSAFKLISYTDTTVIGLRLGAASVALYSLPLQIVEYARMCVGGFSGVLLPRLTLLSAHDDPTKMRDAYLSSSRIGCFFAGWLGAIVISLGPAFLDRWVGPEYAAPSQAVLIWLTIASFGQALSTQVPYPFYQAMGLVTFPAIVLTIEGFSNLGLSLWLAPRMGIAGVALATAIPAVLVSLMLLPSYLCRRLGVTLRTLVIQSVLPGLLMLVVTLSTQLALAMVITTGSYTMIVVRAMLTLPVAVGVLAATFPRDEQLVIRRLLRLSARDNS
jgi:O-antigen/teichoic acid export membrane protein